MGDEDKGIVPSEVVALGFDDAFEALFRQQPGLGVEMWLLRSICLSWFSFGVSYQAQQITRIME